MNNDDDNNKKEKGSWLQSAANIFVIIDAVVNIVSHLSQMYNWYQEYNKKTPIIDGRENNENYNDNYNYNDENNEQMRSPIFPLNPPDDVETDIESESCKICMDNKIQTINLPCGHMVFCFGCSRDFVSNNYEHNCPICRTRITEIKIVYN